MRLALIITVALVALGFICAPLLIYFNFGNFTGPLSASSADWANFGDFIGGVVGPMLSFLSVALLIITIGQQSDANEIARKEQLASQHIRLLGDLLNEVKALLNEPVRVTQGGTEPLKTALRSGLRIEPAGGETVAELVFLVFRYCEAVALYRDNITAHFDCKAYEMQGSRLIDQLRRSSQLLDANQRIQLEFADMHVKGELHRKHAQLS